MPYTKKRTCPNCGREDSFRETKAERPGDMYPGEYIDINGDTEFFCGNCEFCFDDNGNIVDWISKK